MIRFTWLRFRTQAAIALGALVIIAAMLALTGFHMADVHNTPSPPASERRLRGRPADIPARPRPHDPRPDE